MTVEREWDMVGLRESDESEPIPSLSCDEDLEQRFRNREAIIGVVGLGYVGMPLALAAYRAGFRVVGFDIDDITVSTINAGRSRLYHIASSDIAAAVEAGRFRATLNFSDARDVDAIIICVPTPLTAHREPDLGYVEQTAAALVPHLRRGHLVVLESTTWPGTTQEVVKPILERSGYSSGRDFFLAYSPEREDPGNPRFSTRSIPKVIGGDDPTARRLARACYDAFVSQIVTVSSTKVAEAVKLTENIFRAINVALVNELKVVFAEMDINIWEVIDAASTKPFGFMPFYPGPGLGGHCIPIDPFYLTWKAREYGIATKFIELAGEINSSMPLHVVNKLARELDERTGRGLRGSTILVLGMAYKKNVADIRESPSLKLIDLLEARAAKVDYYDPYIERIPDVRSYPPLRGRTRVCWPPESFSIYDAVLIATDHDDVDYASVCAGCQLVVDTRNVLARNGISGPNVVLA